MSLAHLLRSADARLRLDLVRPPTPRLQGAMLPPARLAPPLAASAVAYGVRVELSRGEPSSRGGWRAEAAPEVLATLAPDALGAADLALDRAREEAAMETFDATRIAPLALQLARLDAVVRAGYVDARIGAPEVAEDVAEVADMLARVPWSDLGTGAVAQPVFPGVALALPDAEPDLVVGDAMWTVSPSRAARIEDDDLRTLVARVIIARAEWGAAEAAQRLRTIGILLARHGILWRAPVNPVVAHEAFPAVEAWFLERLEKARREAGDAPEEGERTRAAPMPKWVKKRFAPRPPGTHPEGKAEKKKRAPKPRGPPPDDDAAEQPKRHRTPNADWRRGSTWRRERGL